MTKAAEPDGGWRAPTTGSASPSANWLTLLLDDRPLQQLAGHRDCLVATGTPPQDADRQLTEALALRELLDQRRRRATELAALNDIAGRLASVTDVQPLLREIVEQARNLLHVDLAYLSLVDGDRISIVVAIGQISAELPQLVMPVMAGFSSAVVTTGAPLATSDYCNDRRFEHHPMADRVATLEDIRGLLGVPMFARGRVTGVLFAAKRQERTFTPDEIELLTSLAAHASVALENSRVLADQRRAADDLQAANRRLEAIISWDRTLTHVVLHGGDATDLLAEVSRKAGCPAHFLRVASDLPTALPGVPAAAGQQIFALGIDSESAIEIDAGGPALLAMPVVASGDVLGILLLCRTPELIRGDHAMIVERAAPSMALLLVGQHAAEEAARRTRDGLLTDLLTRPEPDRREAAARARLIGLDPERSHAVVVLLPTNGRSAVRQAVDGLPLPSGSVVGEYGRRVVAVVPATGAEQVAATWFTAPDLPATVGVSAPTHDIADLRRCFRDAVQTVDVLITLGRVGQVGTAERLGMYRILLSQGGPQEIDRLVRLYLGAVQDEEQRSAVPLLETLESYLRNSQRHTVTAADLKIHSNTLYQRLDKLTRILGDRWREPERALDLQLVLRLRQSVARLAEVVEP